jgi:hypothetical protein
MARPLFCSAAARFAESRAEGMSFGGGRYRLTRTMIEGAPADPGVYALWQETS